MTDIQDRVTDPESQAAITPLVAARVEPEQARQMALVSAAPEQAGSLPREHRNERTGLDPAGLLGRSFALDSHERLPMKDLLDIARSVAGSGLWQPFARHDEVERRPVRLLATGSYEVWVIGWTTGQAVELHNHGGSRGALVVTEGVLTEIYGRYASERRALAAGASCALPEALIHDVVNIGVAPATSIHVYSPPLRAMTFYDPVGLHPTRTVEVVPERPVLDRATAARAFHPAAGQGVEPPDSYAEESVA